MDTWLLESDLVDERILDLNATSRKLNMNLDRDVVITLLNGISNLCWLLRAEIMDTYTIASMSAGLLWALSLNWCGKSEDSLSTANWKLQL